MIDRRAAHRKLKELSDIPHGEPHIIVLLADYVEREPRDVKAALAYADALRVVGLVEVVGEYRNEPDRSAGRSD